MYFAWSFGPPSQSNKDVRDALQSFVDASGLPFATMFMDKSVLEEQHPSYIGMYDGKLMDELVFAVIRIYGFGAVRAV